jgi:steroid delta-isomerase-like uncharacterized protein
MAEQSNQALIERYYGELWNRGELDVADEVFAPDYHRHDLRPGDPSRGPVGQKQIATVFRRAFPDVWFELDLLVSTGDYVIARWTATGTHTGAWADIDPTGRRIEYHGVNIFRFEDGKVAEMWNHRDDLGLAQQLGDPVFSGFGKA